MTPTPLPPPSATDGALLLTGASGQIGRWVLHRLLQLAPEVPLVLALRDPDRQLPALKAWLQARTRPSALPPCALTGLSAVPYRLEDTEGAEALVRALRPRALIHLAARFEWGLRRADARQAQLEATEAAWRAQTDPRGHAGRFIALGGYMTLHRPHLGKLGITPNGPVDWPAVYRRVGGYEASKLETQVHMSALAERLGRPWLCVHPATVCGHAEEGELPAHAALYVLCRQLMRGRLSALPGTTRHQLPLVSADHLADFLAHLALDEAVVAGDYLLLDRDSPHFHALVRQLARALGVRAPRRSLPLPVMRWLLHLPGVSAWSGTSAEGLDFLLEAPTFDTRAAEALAARWGLRRPVLSAAVEATAHFVRREAAG